MNLLEIIVGQIPEAIYFALFMIFTKELKTKNLLFIFIMSIEYILIMNIQIFSIWSHILYVALTFMTLKMLYKIEAQITDVFTFGIASIVLMFTSLISTFILRYNFNLGIFMSRILPFLFLLIFKNKLPKIQNLYNILWNRSDQTKVNMKSTTFRSINVFMFNVMFYIINLGMIFGLLIRR